MKIDITYGDGKVSIDIPKKNLASVIVPKQVKPITNMQEELNRVLDNPHG
ncbi:MAG: lactate racemase domain-containing protein, partial [Candidatus Thorarchaeota archaeon]